jgi:DNA-binding CsgD family transcriptional regulator
MDDRNAALPVPAGRPSKLTPEMVAEAGELAAAGLTISKIAVSLGVTERTVYDWMKEGKASPETDLKAQFSQVIHEGWINTGKNYLQNLKAHAASQGGIPAATWFLTHHPFFRDDFSDAAADRRVERKTVATVMDALASAGLTPDDERRVLLQIQARGLGTPAVEGEE